MMVVMSQNIEQREPTDKQGCTQMLQYRSSILSSFVTSNKSNTRCATYGAGHVYPAGASAFIPVFDVIRDFM